MTFFDRIVCKSEAHCGLCRRRMGGRAWRHQVTRGALPPDFDCVRGKAWLTEVMALPGRRLGVSPMEAMARACGPLAAGYIRQLDILYRRPPEHLPCRDRVAYRMRLLAKAKWYREQMN
jgi:hypothetical protein